VLVEPLRDKPSKRLDEQFSVFYTVKRKQMMEKDEKPGKTRENYLKHEIYRFIKHMKVFFDLIQGISLDDICYLDIEILKINR